MADLDPATTTHSSPPAENADSVAVNDGSKLPSSSGAAADRLADLETRVKALEKSDKSLWKRLGILLGVIGGLIALPKGIYDVVDLAHPTPHVQFFWRDFVTLSYDPPTKNLNLVYRLSISNTKGSAEDRINSASIKLQVAQPEPFVIGTPYISFEANQQKMGIPLTVGKGEHKDLSLYVTLKPGLAAYALANPGPRETDVNFTLDSSGPYRSITRRFCLHDMDAEALRRVMGGQPWDAESTSCAKE